jgi:hypothetical protein
MATIAFSRASINRAFALLTSTAVAGERCPKTHPYGPLQDGIIQELVRRNMIRSEVYRQNYRVVTILVGEHRGKTTKAAPKGFKPYLINSERVNSASRRQQSNLAARPTG